MSARQSIHSSTPIQSIVFKTLLTVWTFKRGSQNTLEVTSFTVNRCVNFREHISCSVPQAYNQSLLAENSGLEFRPVRAGFVVGKVALAQKFLLVLKVSFDYYTADASSSSSTDPVILLIESVLKYNTPSLLFYGITNRCHNVQWSFISLQVHSTCFGRHTRPSSGVQS